MAPSQSIVLLEDIDAAFVSREDTAHEKSLYEGLNRLTFSGLLNMLDGVASTEGRIVFMTTNYLERLDPALIRPGRVDVTEYIGHATDHQLKKAFSQFYPEESQNSAEKFVANVRQFDKPVSMAAVQGYFLLHKFSPSDALEDIDSLWRTRHNSKANNQTNNLP
ncbi:Mitochondrial chaperone BCS1 [Halotydeus destructor]|nr:Mitochondrial chaperone BCS1 [Halotydeus destructor]